MLCVVVLHPSGPRKTGLCRSDAEGRAGGREAAEGRRLLPTVVGDPLYAVELHEKHRTNGNYPSVTSLENRAFPFFPSFY